MVLMSKVEGYLKEETGRVSERGGIER